MSGDTTPERLSEALEMDSDQASEDAEAECLEDAEETVRHFLVRFFKKQVSSDCIRILWVEEIESYIVRLETTIMAAELLCHLIDSGDPVLEELTIRAVQYGARYCGEKSAKRKLREWSVLHSSEVWACV